ncbi:MAG: hypothetical protein UY87_C0004G0027, partial [Candidatus Peribacteria bacterium GW2011_GWC2_54_8]
MKIPQAGLTASENILCMLPNNIKECT